MSVWNVVTRLTRSFQPQSTLSGRELQLHLDTAKLFSLKNTTPWKPVFNPAPEEKHVADILGTSPLPPFEIQAKEVTAHLIANTKSNLRVLANALQCVAVDEYLQSKLGFANRIDTSSVKDAGRGVFVDGFAKKGTLLTLYPGVSYLPSQVRHSGLRSGNTTDESAIVQADYFISRYDGVVIDGAAPVELDVHDLLPEDGGPEIDQLVHPFALGHIVNHPPQGERANCLQFMLDIDLASLPKELRSLVPVQNWGPVKGVLERIENEAFRQRVPSSASFASKTFDVSRIRRTVALIATRDIENEEIFMNYRLNPFVPDLPVWYHDCDPEMSSRRWKEKGVFF